MSLRYKLFNKPQSVDEFIEFYEKQSMACFEKGEGMKRGEANIEVTPILYGGCVLCGYDVLLKSGKTRVHIGKYLPHGDERGFFGMGAKSLALVNAIETAEKLAKAGLEVKINEKPYEEVRVQTRNLAEAAFML